MGINKHYYYIDTLKVLACIAVIFLHTSAGLIYSFKIIDHSWWWYANIVDSITRFGVPIFLLVSGLLILDPQKEESLSEYFRKRIKKVIIPFIAWSFIYILWKSKMILISNPFVISWKLEIINILQGQNYYHLGFLYYLIGFYLAAPILRIYIKNAPIQNIHYFIILWLIANPIFSLLIKFLNLNIYNSLQLVLGYVGYFVLGYLLSQYEFNFKKRLYFYILGFIGIFITLFGTYCLILQNGGILDEYFYEYLSLNVIMVSSAIFIFFRSIDWKTIFEKNIRLSSIISNISSASLGIYLIHPIILEILAYLGITGSFIHPLIGIPFTGFLIFLISYLIILVLKRMPLIKIFVP